MFDGNVPEAYAFLQSRRLKAAGRKKESVDRPRNRPDKRSSIAWHDHRRRTAPTVISGCRTITNQLCQSSVNLIGYCFHTERRGGRGLHPDGNR